MCACGVGVGGGCKCKTALLSPFGFGTLNLPAENPELVLLKWSALKSLKLICSLGECRNRRKKKRSSALAPVSSYHFLMVVTFDCTADACNTVPSWYNPFLGLQWGKNDGTVDTAVALFQLLNRTIFVVSHQRLPSPEALHIRGICTWSRKGPVQALKRITTHFNEFN